MKNYWTRITPSLEYAFSNRFALRTELPFSFNHRKEGYKNRAYDAHGIGDITLSGKYWLNEPDPSYWSFYTELALGIPTGEDEDRLPDGTYKKAYIVPGAGTWNPSLGLGLTRTFGDVAVYGSTRYTYTIGENGAKYDSANPFMTSAGISHSLFHWGAKAEKILGYSLNASYLYIATKDKFNGHAVRNTGGNWVHVTPGLFFSPDNGNFTAYLAFPITAYFHVNSLQCAERYSLMMGIQYRF